MANFNFDDHFVVYEKLSVEKSKLSDACDAIEGSGMMSEDIDHIACEIRAALDGLICMQGDIESAIQQQHPLTDEWFKLELKELTI